MTTLTQLRQLHQQGGWPLIAVPAELARALPHLLDLWEAATNEHDEICGCVGEACDLGEKLARLETT